MITDLMLPKYFGVCGCFPLGCWCTGRDFCHGSWASGSASPASLWVMLSLASLLLPQYQHKVYTFSQPATFGEIVFMFWLLIKGARPPAADAAASVSAAD